MLWSFHRKQYFKRMIKWGCKINQSKAAGLLLIKTDHHVNVKDGGYQPLKNKWPHVYPPQIAQSLFKYNELLTAFKEVAEQCAAFEGFITQTSIFFFLEHILRKFHNFLINSTSSPFKWIIQFSLSLPRFSLAFRYLRYISR